MTMKRLLLALAVCTPLAAFAAEAEVKLFPAAGLTGMDISAGGGDITVNASTGSQVRVEITDNDPQKCRLTMKVDGGRLVLKAEQLKKGSFFRPATHEDNCDASFTVSAPAGLELKARSGVGSVTVNGRSGASLLDSGTDSVTVHAVSGELKINTGTGGVKGDACGGTLRVNSGTGDVELTGLCGPASVHSGTGSVSLAWAKVPAKGEVEVKSGTSDINLTFPADASLSLKLKAGTGSVKSEFDTKAGLLVTATSGTGSVRVLKAAK
jgi:hypothetical protein